MMMRLLLWVICWSVGFAVIAEGRVPERDYFTADDDPQARRDLDLNNEHHTNHVLKWLRDGNINMAIQDARFTLNNWPNHPRALMLMEAIGRIAHNPSLPIPYYEKAVTKYPHHAITHAQYGKYLLEIGQLDAGIARLLNAIEIDPKMAAAHAWLAEAYQKKGNTDLARKSAAQAKELGYPGDVFEGHASGVGK